MKNGLSFEEALERVYTATNRNIEKYLNNANHNMIARCFGTHEGYLSEICVGDDYFSLGIRYTQERTALSVMVKPYLRVADEYKEKMTEYINGVLQHTIRGKIVIDGNTIIARESIDLECYVRQLVEFSSKDGVTAKMIDLAADHFAPDAELFEETEHILMRFMILEQDNFQMINEGKTPDENGNSAIHRLISGLSDMIRSRHASDHDDDDIDGGCDDDVICIDDDESELDPDYMDFNAFMARERERLCLGHTEIEDSSED